MQELRQQFRGLDRGRTDEDRLAALAAIGDVFDDGVELVLLREIDEIRCVIADHRHVRRDDNDFEAIDLLKLERLGIRRAGHPGQVVIQPEIVLEGNRGDGLVFLLDRHAFLRLDRLVQAVRPAPAGHRPAREFIDDDDFAVLDDVFDVPVEHHVRAQCRVEMMQQANIGGVVQAFAFAEQPGLDHQLFDVLVTVFGYVYLFRLFHRWSNVRGSPVCRPEFSARCRQAQRRRRARRRRRWLPRDRRRWQLLHPNH